MPTVPPIWLKLSENEELNFVKWHEIIKVDGVKYVDITNVIEHFPFII